MLAPELDAKRLDLLHDAVSGALCRGRVFRSVAGKSWRSHPAQLELE
jgi:hypothetical protein